MMIKKQIITKTKSKPAIIAPGRPDLSIQDLRVKNTQLQAQLKQAYPAVIEAIEALKLEIMALQPHDIFLLNILTSIQHQVDLLNKAVMHFNQTKATNNQRLLGPASLLQDEIANQQQLLDCVVMVLTEITLIKNNFLEYSHLKTVFIDSKEEINFLLMDILALDQSLPIDTSLAREPNLSELLLRQQQLMDCFDTFSQQANREFPLFTTKALLQQQISINQEIITQLNQLQPKIEANVQLLNLGIEAVNKRRNKFYAKTRDQFAKLLTSLESNINKLLPFAEKFYCFYATSTLRIRSKDIKKVLGSILKSSLADSHHNTQSLLAQLFTFQQEIADKFWSIKEAQISKFNQLKERLTKLHETIVTLKTVNGFCPNSNLLAEFPRLCASFEQAAMHDDLDSMYAIINEFEANINMINEQLDPVVNLIRERQTSTEMQALNALLENIGQQLLIIVKLDASDSRIPLLQSMHSGIVTIKSDYENLITINRRTFVWQTLNLCRNQLNEKTLHHLTNDRLPPFVKFVKGLIDKFTQACHINSYPFFLKTVTEQQIAASKGTTVMTFEEVSRKLGVCCP